jgi:hypothetical protein
MKRLFTAALAVLIGCAAASAQQTNNVLVDQNGNVFTSTIPIMTLAMKNQGADILAYHIISDSSGGVVTPSGIGGEIAIAGTGGTYAGGNVISNWVYNSEDTYLRAGASNYMLFAINAIPGSGIAASDVAFYSAPTGVAGATITWTNIFQIFGNGTGIQYSGGETIKGVVGSGWQTLNEGTSTKWQWLPRVTGKLTLYDAIKSGGAANVWEWDGDTGNVTQINGGFTTGSNILSSSPTAGVGYTAGAGNAVTQITNRTTGVTINTTTGTIKLYSAAGSASWTVFTVSDTSIGTNDTVTVTPQAGTTDTYVAVATAVSNGASFKIAFEDITGTTTEQPVLNFTITKGSAN